MNLNIGCGKEAGVGYDAGIDLIHKGPGIINHDLEVIPWPIESDSVTRLRASNILEHISPKRIFDVMNEIHRVCAAGAEVIIIVPRAGTVEAAQDPSHCSNGWNERTLEYFLLGTGLHELYKCADFRLKHLESTAAFINATLEVVK